MNEEKISKFFYRNLGKINIFMFFVLSIVIMELINKKYKFINGKSTLLLVSSILMFLLLVLIGFIKEKSIDLKIKTIKWLLNHNFENIKEISKETRQMNGIRFLKLKEDLNVSEKVVRSHYQLKLEILYFEKYYYFAYILFGIGYCIFRILVYLTLK